MRLFSVFLFALAIAGYQGWKHYLLPHTTPEPAASCGGQTGNILFQSSDGGKTWQDVSQGLPALLEITQMMAQGGEVFLGTENDGLYHSTVPAMGIWEQEQVGVDFPETGEPSVTKRISGIFPGRSGPYVSVPDRGIFQKTAATGTWRLLNDGLKDKTAYAVLERPDGTLFVSNQDGIYKSPDEGKTWEHVFTRSWVNDLESVGDVLVANGYNGLLRSADGGKTWEPVLSHEGANYTTFALDDRIAAIRTGGSWNNYAEGAVLQRVSTDGGKTWPALEESRMPARVYQLVQAGGNLFCSSSAGISRSSDGGKTWELVRPYTDARGKRFLHLAVSGQNLFAVVMQAGC